MLTNLDNWIRRPFEAAGRALLWITGSTPQRLAISAMVSANIIFAVSVFADSRAGPLFAALVTIGWPAVSGWNLSVELRRVDQANQHSMLASPTPGTFRSRLFLVACGCYAAVSSRSNPMLLMVSAADFLWALSMYVLFLPGGGSTLRQWLRDLFATPAPIAT